jgi:septum formation protein
MKYILASASPRRKELLTQAGLEFEVLTSNVEEIITRTVPSEVVIELASQKAENVYQNYKGTEDLVIIGADTVVVYKDEILGKPADEDDAYNMLSMLADRTHQVYTGVCLIIRQNGNVHTHTFFESTDVTFYPICKEDLQSYVESGDPLDKAGAYGIQGPFAIHVKCIHGDYNNVVGLPIARLHQELLKEQLLPETTGVHYSFE